jgi:hypothetical protein
VTLREDNQGALFSDHILPDNIAARNPESPDYNAGTGETDSFDQIAERQNNFNLQIRSLNDGPRAKSLPVPKRNDRWRPRRSR